MEQFWKEYKESSFVFVFIFFYVWNKFISTHLQKIPVERENWWKERGEIAKQNTVCDRGCTLVHKVRGWRCVIEKDTVKIKCRGIAANSCGGSWKGSSDYPHLLSELGGKVISWEWGSMKWAGNLRKKKGWNTCGKAYKYIWNNEM